MINYVQGDATRPIGDGPKFILHIVNDVGLWGAGFVMAVSRRWPEPEKAYRSLNKHGQGYPLGIAQHVEVEDDLYVVNMVAQEGVGSRNGPPIRYEALRSCLKSVAESALHPAYRKSHRAVSIHAPRFGAGLAGGSWTLIEGIIEATLVYEGLSVTIYDLPG